MTKHNRLQNELRGNFGLRYLDRARESVRGPIHVVLARIALATVLMFMLVTGHMLMGNTGVVFVCVLFLIGALGPFLLQKLGWDKRSDSTPFVKPAEGKKS